VLHKIVSLQIEKKYGQPNVAAKTVQSYVPIKVVEKILKWIENNLPQSRAVFDHLKGYQSATDKLEAESKGRQKSTKDELLVMLHGFKNNVIKPSKRKLPASSAATSSNPAPASSSRTIIQEGAANIRQQSDMVQAFADKEEYKAVQWVKGRVGKTALHMLLFLDFLNDIGMTFDEYTTKFYKQAKGGGIHVDDWPFMSGTKYMSAKFRNWVEKNNADFKSLIHAAPTKLASEWIAENKGGRWE